MAGSPGSIAPLSPKKVSRNVEEVARRLDYEKRAIGKRVRPLACSTSWEEFIVAQLLAGRAKLPRDERPRVERARSEDPLFSELAKRGIYPPPAENTPMQRCDRRDCRRRLYPANYVRADLRTLESGAVAIDVQTGRAKSRRRCVDCLEGIRLRMQREWEQFCAGAAVPAGPDRSQSMTCQEMAERGMEVVHVKLPPEDDASLAAYVARVSSTPPATLPVSFA